MSSLVLLKYLALPARLLPKSQRGGVAFSVLTLGIGLDRSESLGDAGHFVVNWVKSLSATFAFGQVMTELGTPQLYEREWKTVQGKPPVDEMVAWMYRAIHNGPGTAYSIGVSVGDGARSIWGGHFRRLSESIPLLDEMREHLNRVEFNGEDVWLSALPAATLGGVPLRPLPLD